MVGCSFSENCCCAYVVSDCNAFAELVRTHPELIQRALFIPPGSARVAARPMSQSQRTQAGKELDDAKIVRIPDHKSERGYTVKLNWPFCWHRIVKPEGGEPEDGEMLKSGKLRDEANIVLCHPVPPGAKGGELVKVCRMYRQKGFKKAI
jgi:hypothetical protein